MPATFRLHINQGILARLPYSRSQQDSFSSHSNGNHNRIADYGPKNDAVPPLAFYALQSLFVELETEQGEESLPDFGELRRIPIDTRTINLLYPKMTTINTSPLRWAIFCRLFSGLSSELKTFHLPLSDPYVLPFQRWDISSSLNIQFLTTISLGRFGNDAAIPAIAKVTTLVALDLNCSAITTVGFNQLASVLESRPSSPSRLSILLLARSPAITPNIIEPLRKLKSLQYVDLRGCRCESTRASFLKLFPDEIPEEILDLKLLSGPNLFRALESFNRRTRPSMDHDEGRDSYILDIDRLDYPKTIAHPQRRRTGNPHEIYSEGYYFMVSPSGRMVMGDADTLVKIQERPIYHEKPLPRHLYEVAEGMEIKRRTEMKKSLQDVGPETPRSSDHVAIPAFNNKGLDILQSKSRMGGRRRGLFSDPGNQTHTFYEPLHLNSTDRPNGLYSPINQTQKSNMIFFRSIPPPDLISQKFEPLSQRQSSSPQKKRVRTMFTSNGNNGDITNLLRSRYSVQPRSVEKQGSSNSVESLPRNPFRIAK